jgi:hypothetical protein
MRSSIRMLQASFGSPPAAWKGKGMSDDFHRLRNLHNRHLGARKFPALIRSSYEPIHSTSRAMSGGGSVKLWGGRFEKDTDKDAVAWAESLTCDLNMVRMSNVHVSGPPFLLTIHSIFQPHVIQYIQVKEDLWGSMAHVTMLGHQGVIPAADAGKIIQQLLEFQVSRCLSGGEGAGFHTRPAERSPVMSSPYLTRRFLFSPCTLRRRISWAASLTSSRTSSRCTTTCT